MKNLKLILSFLLATIIFPFCKKFLIIEPPVDRLSSEVVFNDAQTATSAVIGIYTSMMSITPTITSGGITLCTGLTSDELTTTDMSNTALLEFAGNSILSNNSLLGNEFWFKAYNLIYQSNACIEGLNENTNLPSSLRSQLLGEALFTRSFVYFYLVNLFGDVPLILQTNYEENSTLPRSSANLIYNQIISDLKQAQGLLIDSYPTSERIRPNKWTAAALLSKVYLTLGKWQMAEKEASSIINSGNYSLESDLNRIFLSTSKEAIWQLMPVEDGFNTTEGLTFVPYSWSSSPPPYVLTRHLLETFELGDKRKEIWVGSTELNGDSYYYPYKYKINDYGLPITEYYMIFRLAEQYLIRAECLARQEKLTEAKKDIDALRERAGLSATSANQLDEVLSAVIRERRIELFSEWGNRWIDLKRTQTATEILSTIKPSWNPTDTLFPIPARAILGNPALVQNKGY